VVKSGRCCASLVTYSRNVSHFITSALLVTCDINHIQQVMFSKWLPDHQISLNLVMPNPLSPGNWGVKHTRHMMITVVEEERKPFVPLSGLPELLSVK